jgi:hypothetical protein
MDPTRKNKEKIRRRRRRRKKKKRLCVPHIKHTSEDKANVKRKRNRHNLPKDLYYYLLHTERLTM